MIPLLFIPLFGYAFIQLFFFSAPAVNEENTFELSGQLKAARIIKRIKGGDALEIILNGQDIPLRSNLGYPEKYSKNYSKYLTQGTQITVRVENRYLNKALMDLTRSQRFYPIVSIKSNNQLLLTMQGYNEYQSMNITIGKWITTILTLCGVYILLASFYKPHWLEKA